MKVVVLLAILVSALSAQKRAVSTEQKKKVSADSSAVAPADKPAGVKVVRAGTNLQAALNAAKPGDTIKLEAGAVFTGNFTLPAAKQGDAPITLTTTAELPDRRVTLADRNLMASIQSPNTMPALT